MPTTNPYHGVDWSAGRRGNLHCHSTQSDGKASPQAVIAAYGDLGYDFLMLSDHDIYTAPEILARAAADDVVLLPGCEVSQNGPHLLQIGGSHAAAPVEDRQQVIDAIRADGGFAVLNHPNWFAEHDHFPQEQLVALQNYAGIEIYNALIGELPGSPYALNRWDRLLSRRRRVWGYANDDAHALAHIGQGWMVAFPTANTAPGIIDALASGRFYGSSGVAIGSITVTDGTVTIVAPEAERIIAVGEWGRRIKVIDQPELTVALPESGYVRFECFGGGERQAWSQPITCGW